MSSVRIAGSTPSILCVYGPLGQPSASYSLVVVVSHSVLTFIAHVFEVYTT